MKIKRFAALGVAAALTLSLAACGDDSDSGSENNGGETETQTIRLWLNGEDTPQELVDYAIAEFNKIHPNAEVQFERQQWTGIVEKLTTALSSSDSPDVVELGNSQAQTFEAAGALMNLSDKQEELGGDDLLDSLVEAGSYNGEFYGVPYYAGVRIVFYRKDLFAASGLSIPTTIDEFVNAGIKLKADNAATPNFSGIYFPGKYWYAALPFIWENGGDIAAQDDDNTWVGELASSGSVTGLEVVKKIMDEASAAPKDGDESKDHVAFCAGEVGMLMGPAWKGGDILSEEIGCPAMEPNLGAFALPGNEAGTTAPAFLGGSNIAISENSQNKELAYDLVKILNSDGFQEQFAALGLVPNKKSLLDKVTGTEAKDAQAEAAVNTRFTPSSENWAAVEAGTVLPDMLVAIAQGADIESEAARADESIVATLNG